MNENRSGKVRVPAGFTLVELMVSLIISMLLIIAIASLYLGQLRSYDTQSDLSLVQESARAIGQMLQRDARQAGYTDYATLNRFGSATNIIDAVNDQGTNSSDTLSFRFYGSSTPGAATADGSIVDCTGTAAQNATLIFETYSVVTDATTGEPWLQCSVNGNASAHVPGGRAIAGVVRRGYRW
ncbi:PilW family protein [Cupriavidus sp. D39]|uniref:PilW family protein n=1 Tax=Cupriavidus sp. D39 TaxID=2997877 RepID=UPI00226E17DA|nr:prepilin-type N-terminal cleavage/methylation domain-containing protein [Cupriavidus sp. D39]MCY0856151.1 prepilin-type N-terminal cleavage/methylation domain-containing protein [Cupriavidus sp. D39]